MKTCRGVIIIAYKANPLQILLIKNAKTRSITPVSGAIKEGESLKDAAVRELKEETGLMVLKDKLKETAIKHIFTYGPQKQERAGDLGLNSVLLLDASDLPTPHTTKDAYNFKWLSPKDAIRKITFPDLKEIVEKAIKLISTEDIKQASKISSIKKVFFILLLLSIISFVYSHFRKNNLPKPDEILNSLYQEPKQTEISMDPFTIEKEGFEYNITPKYSYELYGLIVTDYDSENPFDLSHENDPLNTKDVCVIWDDNLKNEVYRHMKYNHGEWTCYAEFKSGVDASWYEKFNPFKLSNNHLLPKGDNIYKEIKASKIGDQIYFKGHLIDYSIKTPQGQTGERTTSTNRTDTGCEIIYVEEFRILKEGNTLFLLINNIAKYAIIACLIVLILLFLFV